MKSTAARRTGDLTQEGACSSSKGLPRLAVRHALQLRQKRSIGHGTDVNASCYDGIQFDEMPRSESLCCTAPSRLASTKHDESLRSTPCTLGLATVAEASGFSLCSHVLNVETIQHSRNEMAEVRQPREQDDLPPLRETQGRRRPNELRANLHR